MVDIGDDRRALEYFGGRSSVSLDEYCDYLDFKDERKRLRNKLINDLITCLRRR